MSKNKGQADAQGVRPGVAGRAAQKGGAAGAGSRRAGGQGAGDAHAARTASGRPAPAAAVAVGCRVPPGIGAGANVVNGATGFLASFLTVDGAVFLVLLAGLVFAPWVRGLFFPMEQMVALLIALGLFAARWWVKFSRNDYDFLRTPLDWAALGLLGAYVLSTFFAANVRNAIQEDIKVLLYFIAFWLVRELARDDRRRAMVLGAVAVTGAWLAVLGVGVAAGTFQYNGAFDGMRIYSAMQYPNTLASYLTAAFFCALALWARSAAPAWLGDKADGGAGGLAARVLRQAWPAYLWAPAAFMSLFVFVFTYSDGGRLVFLPIAALFLVLQPPGRRLGATVAMAAAAATVAPLAGPFAAAVAAKDAGGVWRAFMLGVPLGLILNAATLAVLAGLDSLPGAFRTRIVAGAGALAVLAGVLFTADRGLVPKLIQWLAFIPQDYNARSRIQWTFDALRIIKDHPVLGAGGGGWDALYHNYQSYGYWSTQVHNHFMQVWVETGTVGFLTFAALWVLVLWHGFRAWRAARADGDASRGAILAGALTGIAALLAHSFIDFNLSLSSVTLALWSLAGVIRTMPVTAGADGAGFAAARAGGTAARAAQDYRFLPRLAVYGGTIIAGTGVAMLLGGFFAGQAAVRALNGGEAAEARDLFDRAVRLDPFTASFRVDAGQARLAAAQQAGAKAGAAGDIGRAVGEALAGLRRAVELEPYNANYRSFLGSLLLQTGDAENGLKEFERAVALQPYVAERYENLAMAYAAVGRGELARPNGRKDLARSVLQRALTVPEQLRKRSASVPAWAAPVFPTPPATPRLALYVGQARAMLGDLAGAEKDLRQATAALPRGPQQAEAYVWLGAVLEKQGKAAEAAQAIGQAKAVEPGVERIVPQVRTILQR